MNRLRPILQFIISPYQSAFVPNRAIHDNISIAAELFHHIRTAAPTIHPKIALKLDIKKAFDNLDWGFIEVSLMKLGFPKQFIRYIMTCITTVTYGININGTMTGNIKTTRGLRQGDPLSPYIFIICAEILSTNLGKLEMQGKLEGLKMSKRGPAILHLMYADDLLITCKAKLDTHITLLLILQKYSASAGQEINKAKSTVIHHPKLWQHKILDLENTFQISATADPPKYLGITFKRGRNSAHIYVDLLNRIQRKAQGWISKCINQVERVVLINTSLTPTTNHVMQTLLLPAHMHKKWTKL